MRIKFPLVGVAAPVAFLLGSCAISTIAPAVTPAMVAGSRGHSAGELKRGRDLFGTRCTACHTADPVAKHSVSEWNGIVDDMAGRSKLSADERSALMAYIEAAHASLHVSAAH